MSIKNDKNFSGNPEAERNNSKMKSIKLSFP